jgi:Serine dehydratase beta chain
MNLSVLDIFKIGVGPSSSHTMGPMNAARRFVSHLFAQGLLERTAQVGVQLYGSLALTGKGHCTDRAVLLGLEGADPATLDPDTVEPTLQRIRSTGRLRLAGTHEIAFDEPMDVLWHRDQVLPGHSNGMRFTALDADRIRLLAMHHPPLGVERGEAHPIGVPRQHLVANPPRPPSPTRSRPGPSCWSGAALMGSTCMSWSPRTSADSGPTPRRAPSC